jgi:hypothetical protein
MVEVGEKGLEIGIVAGAEVFEKGRDKAIPRWIMVPLLEGVHPDGGIGPEV